MISIIYVPIGILVWLLVHQLKQQQIALYNNMTELESTRQKLNIEEKLVAVGRLVGGIAHEIRNPVAMISSSLAAPLALFLGRRGFRTRWNHVPGCGRSWDRFCRRNLSG